MKKTLKLLSCIALLSTAGCVNSIPSLSPELWRKKILLECGVPDFDKVVALDLNQYASIEMCMAQSGFRPSFPIQGFCENHKAENLPICRPGAVMPQRSVERRLKSPYCKKHSEQYECQP
ncbi:hypothetical protein [Bartonella harrusi]|uniref:Lipoprotein n=1 Tax=Bartonella harrusi TaxID=2961895 RepID=A0ABY5EX29_9HYPH|nr:hypothetical protein [Bartonella harrusi]UTO28640.1 hypothetical protein NMK50_01015 [Bartonella harrusi]